MDSLTNHGVKAAFSHMDGITRPICSVVANATHDGSVAYGWRALVWIGVQLPGIFYSGGKPPGMIVLSHQGPNRQLRTL